MVRYVVPRGGINALEAYQILAWWARFGRPWGRIKYRDDSVLVKVPITQSSMAAIAQMHIRGDVAIILTQPKLAFVMISPAVQ